MIHKKIIGGLGFLFSGSGLFALNQEKPNIIYVFADQLRTDVLGCAGDTKAITPNIDRFAAQSVKFTNAITATPVSAAQRASLFTGKYQSSTGMVINEINMNPNHTMLPHVLNEAGYNLGYIGKMHLNDQHQRNYSKGPERIGWDGYWAAYSFNHRSYSGFYFTDNEDGEEIRVDLKGQYSPTIFTGAHVQIDFL